MFHLPNNFLMINSTFSYLLYNNAAIIAIQIVPLDSSISLEYSMPFADSQRLCHRH